jgi:hypothetical protein
MGHSAQARWVAGVVATVKHVCDLSATVRRKNHTVVVFTDGVRKYSWVVGSTPADRNQNRLAIATLLRGLRERFGIERIQHDFPMQSYVGTPEYDTMMEDVLNRDWSVFQARLERGEFYVEPPREPLPRDLRVATKKTFKKIAHECRVPIPERETPPTATTERLHKSHGQSHPRTTCRDPSSEGSSG